MNDQSEKELLIEAINAFKALDTSKDGFVTKDELDQVLIRTGNSCLTSEALMKYVDVNNDGKISIEEFLKDLQMSQ